MGLVRHVKVRALDSFKSAMTEFYTPQSSHETILVQVAPHTRDSLFVHHFQTDQLLAVRGSMVLVILRDRQYDYIPLSQSQPIVVEVPPGVPHGALNPSDEPCVLVNAVLRQGEPDERDYRPMPLPFPYDIQKARAALAGLEQATA